MFWNNFYQACQERKIKPTPLAEELNISKGSITSWKNGGIPNGETLIKISEYLDVSIDYLLKGDPHYVVKSNGYVVKAEQSNNNGNNIINNAPAQSSSGTDELSEELLKKFKNLSFDEKLEVFNYIKNIKEN